MNINLAINEGSKILKSKFIPNSQLDSEILMAKTINKDRNYILLNSNKILNKNDLPLRLVASTPCFRKEAGSYGKDTKGMIRQHQFYKVELVSVVEPENCKNELERMTNCATDILDKLELPYRKVILCSGDMGFSAEKTYDI